MEENRNENMEVSTEPPSEEVMSNQEESVPLTTWQKIKRWCNALAGVVSAVAMIMIIAMLVSMFGISKTSLVEETRDGTWDGNGITSEISTTNDTVIAYSPDLCGSWIGHVSKNSDDYLMLVITQYDEDPVNGPAAIGWVENSQCISNICYGNIWFYNSDGTPSINEKNIVPFHIDPSLNAPTNAFTVYFQDNYGQVVVVEDLIPGKAIKCYRAKTSLEMEGHDYTFKDLESALPFIGPSCADYSKDGKHLGTEGFFKDSRTLARQAIDYLKPHIPVGTYVDDAASPYGRYQATVGQFHYRIIVSEYKDPATSSKIGKSVVRLEKYDPSTRKNDMIDFRIYSADTKEPIVLSTVDTETLETRVYGTIGFFQDGFTLIFDTSEKPYPYIDLSQYSIDGIYFEKWVPKSSDDGLLKSDTDGRKVYMVGATPMPLISGTYTWQTNGDVSGVSIITYTIDMAGNKNVPIYFDSLVQYRNGDWSSDGGGIQDNWDGTYTAYNTQVPEWYGPDYKALHFEMTLDGLRDLDTGREFIYTPN